MHTILYIPVADDKRGQKMGQKNWENDVFHMQNSQLVQRIT